MRTPAQPRVVKRERQAKLAAHHPLIATSCLTIGTAEPEIQQSTRNRHLHRGRYRVCTCNSLPTTWEMEKTNCHTHDTRRVSRRRPLRTGMPPLRGPCLDEADVQSMVECIRLDRDLRRHLLERGGVHEPGFPVRQ